MRYCERCNTYYDAGEQCDCAAECEEKQNATEVAKEYQTDNLLIGGQDKND